MMQNKTYFYIYYQVYDPGGSYLQFNSFDVENRQRVKCVSAQHGVSSILHWFFVTLYVACGGAETVSNVKILVSDRFEGRTRVFQLKLSKVFADRACEICNALRNFSQKTRDLPSNHRKLVFERWKQFLNRQKLHSNVTDIFVLFSNRLFEKDN